LTPIDILKRIKEERKFWFQRAGQQIKVVLVQRTGQGSFESRAFARI
jgi:hypothetical protein